MTKSTLTSRELIATDRFREAQRQLAAIVFPTPQLELIVADIKRLHGDINDRLDWDEAWGPNNRVAARNLIILGANGTSKSYTAKYALAALKPVKVGPDQFVDPKVLYREARRGEARAWQQDLLAQMGYNMARMPSSEAAMAQIESRVRLLKPTMIVCDELTRILNSRNYSTRRLGVESEIVWNQLMQIQSDPVWPTPTVAIGTMELRDSLQIRRPGSEELVGRGDVLRRSDITVLPSLTLDDAGALEDYINEYCTALNVKNRITKTRALGFRLVNASRRGIGTALVFAQWAVALASLRGKQAALHLEDFAHVAEIRTSCRPENNLFLVDDWEQIDFEKVAPDTYEEARYRSDDDDDEAA